MDCKSCGTKMADISKNDHWCSYCGTWHTYDRDGNEVWHESELNVNHKNKLKAISV